MGGSQLQSQGKLYIVGIGPGAIEEMTIKARDALLESDVVVGNKSYIDLVKRLLDGKEVIESSMGKEVERARKALLLSKDNIVSIVSGGDAHVYGMAGIVFEIAESMDDHFEIEVLSGVSSVSASSSRIGAPLNNDFAVVSLSDLLTPWEMIEENLSAVSSSNFCIALYNPKSQRRNENFTKAIEIIKRYRDDDTPVGVVKDCSREGEEFFVTTLGEVLEFDDRVDMHTTVIIGNRESRIWNNWIITPRGYHRKYRI
ncbi:MAG TPA: precorrin-3B C(17)-methyltransferase [Candidatus Methanoperedenaceae archaeon]|nr:precorrin-3B C(17)-methyltransferase [Candidatus Methanoperedenaceae archaeon]